MLTKKCYSGPTNEGHTGPVTLRGETMKARTRRLEHSVELDAADDRVRVATGFAYGLGISIALWMIGAAVVFALVR